MTETLQPPWTRTDPVGEALHVLRMSGVFYCRSDLSAPWGFTLPAMPACLWFHVVTAGRCRLEVGGTVLEVGAGDLVLVPRGEGHALRSEATAAVPSILTIPHDLSETGYAQLRWGGGGEVATMVCGAVRFDHPAARTLVDLMPPLVHLPMTALPSGEHGRLAQRVQDTLRLMAVEVEEVAPGGEAVITRLADVLVVQALRTWLATDPGARTGWLGALSDPQVGRALALVHRDPARDWSVADLAAAVAMSRSAFSARFSQLVGQSAMAYVTRWRMTLALDRLRTSDATVVQVAGELGYRSEAAFSRAFTRVVGTPPSVARRTADGSGGALGAGAQQGEETTTARGDGGEVDDLGELFDGLDGLGGLRAGGGRGAVLDVGLGREVGGDGVAGGTETGHGDFLSTAGIRSLR